MSKNLPTVVDDNKDVDDDYEFSRDTYRDLIEKGSSALEVMSSIANDSEHPRAFEVLANLLKTNADITDKLMELQTKKDKIKAGRGDTKESSDPTKVTNNNVFVGSTAELQKMLSGTKDEKQVNGE